MKKTEFAVIVASYNNEYWCSKNISSIIGQSYPHFHLYYIDDASTDETGELAELFCLPVKEKCTIIHNKKRKGSLENIYNTACELRPEQVVVCIDGDDWLAHDNVLEMLADIYANSNTWLTYGSFETDPPSKPFHRPYHEFSRKEPFLAVHLKTFYAKLFQKIKKEDLQLDGTFFSTCGDMGFMLPMLEMAGKEHSSFVKDYLYIYNVHNPLSDARAYKEELARMRGYIQSKTPYSKIASLFP